MLSGKEAIGVGVVMPSRDHGPSGCHCPAGPHITVCNMMLPQDC